MSATYLNARPILRSCDNCAYKKVQFQIHEHCLRYGWSCQFARMSDDLCGKNLQGWQAIPAKPARRSLRRWLIDLFWT